MPQHIQQLMKLHKFQDAAGEHGSAAGSGGASDSAAKVAADAAAVAAAKTVADAAAVATAKAAEDKAAADLAAGLSGQAGKPSDSEAKLLKDVMKQKARAQELEAQLSQVTEKLKPFEGLDAVQIKAMLDEQAEAERKRLEKAGDYDRLTKQMAERHAQEKTVLEQAAAEESRAKAALQGQIAELTVGNSFASSKFVQDDLTLTVNKARVVYGAHFEYKDGQVVGFDKPVGAKDRTVLVNASGDPLNFDAALRQIVDADPDRDALIRSKMKSGAASSTSVKGAKKAGEQQEAQLSSVDRIAAGLKALAKANQQ
jgi:hypothetical protein